MVLIGSSGREYETLTYAEELERRKAEREEANA